MFLTSAIRMLKPAQLDALLKRRDSHLEGLDGELREIFAAVASEGDAAVVNFTATIDRVRLDPEKLVAGRNLLEDALSRLDPEVRGALERAAAACEETQRALLAPPVVLEGDGVRIEARPVPAIRAGIVAQADHDPLSVLGALIAARIAGVEDVTVTAAPRPDATVPDLLMAAAALGGADRIYVASGAPGVAALAHGTDSVARVEKLAGAGSRQVSAAKRLLFGRLEIDMLAGPAEIVILADKHADPGLIALDLFGHAERDPAVLPLLITDDPALAKAAREALAGLLRDTPGRELVQAALLGGGLLVVDSLDEGLRVAERIAPELLQLAVQRPGDFLPHIRRAGLVLSGQASAPALVSARAGLAGALPSGGTARWSPALSANFFRRMQHTAAFTAEAARREGPDALILARASGQSGRAAALEARLQK